MFHKHRILPGHMGGTYNPTNVISLTIPQHAEAHRLLWEQYGHREDYIAWQGLSGLIDKEEILHAVLSMAGSKPKSSEHRQRIGLSNRGNKRPDLAARNRVSTTKGQIKTLEHRQKISQAMMGHTVTVETRKKISQARKELS
jgi:hypothetical protein